MFYLEDKNNDLLMGDPLETEAFFMQTDEEKVDANGKDPAKEKTTSEASDSESVAEAAPSEDEAPVEEAPADEVVEEVVEEQTEESLAEAAPSEEAPADEVVEEVVEEQTEELVAEAAPPEEAPADEVVEEVVEESSSESIEGEPAKPELDPEEAAYIAQQTNVYQATYFDMRKDLPKFRSGDKVSVGYRVIEGGRSRIQNFDGVVIKISSGHGMDKTFTVRKVSGGIGVERIFPLHSPNIQSIKVLKEGKVRRAKLYYLRSRVGKATRIKERPSQ